MRPTPTRLPDDLIAPVCRAMGLGDPADLNEATRAVAQAQTRAQIVGRPQRRVGHYAPPRAAASVQTTLGFHEDVVDVKRRAANDIDEE